MKLLENMLFKLKGKVIAAALFALTATCANAGLINLSANGISFDYEDDEIIVKTGYILLDKSSGNGETTRGIGTFDVIRKEAKGRLINKPLWESGDNNKELNFTVEYGSNHIDLDLYVNGDGTFDSLVTNSYIDDSNIIINEGDLFLSLDGTWGTKDSGWYLDAVGGTAQNHFNDKKSKRDMYFSYTGTGFSDKSTEYNFSGASYLRSVPEPTTLALLGLGLAGIGFSRKKRAS